MIEIEVTQPLPDVTLAEEEQGMAVCVRYRGRPIGFWMQAQPGGTQLSAEALGQEISARIREEWLRAHIRTALPSPGDAPMPRLTVAICTKDRPERLARCLASLQTMQAQEAAATSIDVLVVDNAPSDERTVRVVAPLSFVRYVREPRPGLDFARNRALSEAEGDLIAFLDDDVVVDPGWLAGLREAWREHPDAAAFTGLVLPLALETEAQVLFEQHGGFRRGFKKLRYQGQDIDSNPLYPCAAGIFGAGANMAFRRDVLQELGGFDPALDTGSPLPGGGDLDMFYRVIRAGYPLVYEPRYLVFHEHRREMEALRRQYESWGLGFMAFLAKSYRTDPAFRGRILRLILWWFRYQLYRLRQRVTGRYTLPLSHVLAELRGGFVGLLGEYRRSERRIARIEQRHAHVFESPQILEVA